MLTTLYNILESIVRSWVYKLKLRAFMFRCDVVPLIIVFTLYITRLVESFIHGWRVVRDYNDPRYMLEPHLNESSNAKTMYMIRSLMLLSNIFVKWKLNCVIKILDLGCGIGTTYRYYEYVAKHFINLKVAKKSLDLVFNSYVVSCDISLLMLYVCKLRYSKETIFMDLVLCDAQYLPFRANAFNAITSYEVLEHLDQPISTLKSLFLIVDKVHGLMLLNYDIDWPDPLRIAPCSRIELEHLLEELAQTYGFKTSKIIIPEVIHNPLYIIMGGSCLEV